MPKNFQFSELNLILTIAFIQGALDLYSLPIFYFYKDALKVTPATISFINGLCQLPWCIKPIFGFLSDSFPIIGYRRKSYLIIVSVIEALGFIYLGLYASNAFETGSIQIVQYTCMVFRNVIGEALIVGLTRDNETELEGEKDE